MVDFDVLFQCSCYKLKWLSGLPSLKQGMDLRPQEAAQEALTFDISMIPFEAAVRRTQFNTTVISNCSRTTIMFTTIPISMKYSL